MLVRPQYVVPVKFQAGLAKRAAGSLRHDRPNECFKRAEGPTCGLLMFERRYEALLMIRIDSPQC